MGTDKIDRALATGFRKWGRCMLFQCQQNHLAIKLLLKIYFRTNSSMISFFLHLLWFHSVFTRYPLITLAASAILVISLSVGVFYMQITTDPVELWAGPHSRSRAEKDYFDNTFGPFYRTAQVFIKPVYRENIRHETIAGTLVNHYFFGFIRFTAILPHFS